MVAFGVPVPGDLDGGFHGWILLYILMSFVLAMNVTGWRVSGWAILAAVAGGHLWLWATTPLGVIPAAAVALLVMLAAAGIRRRRQPRIPPR
jgi:hypothetical protein